MAHAKGEVGEKDWKPLSDGRGPMRGCAWRFNRDKARRNTAYNLGIGVARKPMKPSLLPNEAGEPLHIWK